MSPTAVALAEAPAAAAPAEASVPAKKLALPNNNLEQLIAATPACLLRPLRFFVSWQGVLTLAYRCGGQQLSGRQVSVERPIASNMLQQIGH